MCIDAISQSCGATLSLDAWGEYVWKVTFPLLDTLSPRVRRNALTPASSPDITTHTDDVDTLASDSSSSSSRDESKVVALQSIGAIISKFLLSKVIHLPSFGAVWETFVTLIRDAFLSLMVVPSAHRCCAVLSVRGSCYRCCAIKHGGTSIFSCRDLGIWSVAGKERGAVLSILHPSSAAPAAAHCTSCTLPTLCHYILPPLTSVNN